MVYQVPREYYFRIHHIRPRFKGNVENVLIYIAAEIAKIDEKQSKLFKKDLNNAIRKFPGNAIVTEKTINNWRTEISSLFGFLQFRENGSYCRPGQRAIELSVEQDLISAFRKFLLFFQYPGAHLKPREIANFIELGVRFKPVDYLLNLLLEAEKIDHKRAYITKPEATHLILNDLRCTRDNRPVAEVWNKIKKLRENHTEFDSTGDVIRYAGDILDYLVFADLLGCDYNQNYSINRKSLSYIEEILPRNDWFDLYDGMISKRLPDIDLIKSNQDKWFDFVNGEINGLKIGFDARSLIPDYRQIDYQEIAENNKVDEIAIEKPKIGKENTKEIGDSGEYLVHGHECEKLRLIGRKDLIHLVKIIPSQFAVGYDIQSLSPTETRKHIEVKTTVSNKPLTFDRVHLTPNEYRAATTYRENYFIYRLGISKNEQKLFILQDPVGLYKEDKIQMVPTGNGAEFIFNSSNIGSFEELLIWAG